MFQFITRGAKTIFLFIFTSAFAFTAFSFVLASCVTGEACINDPLNLGAGGVPILIGRIIKAILGVVGSLALVMFIYGGFLWMTSSGNRDKVEKGKNTLVWATIGMVVIFASYALVKFVLGDVLGLK